MRSPAFFGGVFQYHRCRQTIAAWVTAICLVTGCSAADPQSQSPAARRPDRAIKLVFIHHSCGENWLADENGGLGRALAEHGYFVSDTNYGWGPEGIGDRTDITDWPEWFVGRRSPEYLAALYREAGQNCSYARTAADPGGENEIVMFKSCFPNSNLEGRPGDPPARGEGLTVANAKAIYVALLKYFLSRPDKLFVVVTAPPVRDRTWAANARAFNKWLVREWLSGYTGKNVAVFDFHNVLTSPRNHHRCRDGKIEYTCDQGGDTLHYPSDGDDHPSAAGNRKATAEFVSLLNYYYDRWSAARPRTAAAPGPGASSPPPAKDAKSPPAKDAKSPPAKGEKSPPAKDAKSPPAKDAKSPPPGGGPEPAEPAIVAAAGDLIDDFESDPKSWEAFLDSATDTRLTFRRDTSRPHAGKASLRIDYDLAPESWALCSLVFDRPQDWSRFRGLSLYLHTAATDPSVAIVGYGGKTSYELLNFECRLAEDRGAGDGWRRLDIPWAQLKLPEWQGDSNAKYNPGSAMGVAIAIHSSAGNRLTGTLWIDDVQLLADK